jgi:hypothetical protein
MTASAPRQGAKQRLIHEMRSYALTVLYLAICFGAIQAYKAALLTEEQVRYTSYGFAIVKAMVLAKFMMVGDAVNASRRIEGESLARGVLRSSLRMMLILVALSVVEELVVGAVHGAHPAQVFAEHMDGGRWAEFLAHALLLWLILLPYLGLKHLAEVMGPEAFRRALRGQR